MTSPTPPRTPAGGKPVRAALSPSTKIFAATTTLLIGSAVALTFWKPSLDLNDNPLLDRLLVSAPLPGVPLPSEVASKSLAESHAPLSETSTVAKPEVVAALPSLDATPALDTGNVKYAQVFPPPILAEEPVLRTSRKEMVSGQHFPNVTVGFKRIHAPAPEPPKLERPNRDFGQRPTSASSVEMSDALLPFFHTTENLVPLEKRQSTEQGPENPFQTAPSAAESPTVEPPELDRLTPLRPLPSNVDALTELKPLRRMAEKP